MYTPYYDSFGLPDDEPSLSVFDDESVEIPEPLPAPSLYAPAPIAESVYGPQFLAELNRSLKALRKAAVLSEALPLDQRTREMLTVTQLSMHELCLKVASDAESSGSSSPNVESEFDASIAASPSAPSAIPVEAFASKAAPGLSFPDYSSVLRSKPIETPKVDEPALHARQEESKKGAGKEDKPETTFMTLTFTDDGTAIVPPTRDTECMAPPKSRGKGCKKGGKLAALGGHLKAWKSQPYGPRQLLKGPNDLMNEFVLDPATQRHQQQLHAADDVEFFLQPAAHTQHRQLN